jgi:hypothetical protein
MCGVMYETILTSNCYSCEDGPLSMSNMHFPGVCVCRLVYVV